MTDEQLIDMTWDMHKTEPYDVLTYEQKWIEFQKYYNELLPTMPIYSNVYFDFHTNWLQNYYAGSGDQLAGSGALRLYRRAG